MLDEIRQRYAGKVDEQSLADAAIQAMVASLDDPNCEYLRGAAAEALETQIRGTSQRSLESCRDQVGDHVFLYVRLPAFHRGVAAELRKQLANEEGLAAVCLDLRNNAGGLLTEAVEVCDLFLSQGVIVASTIRDAPNKTWRATTDEPPGAWERPRASRPVVVLVNRFTASAAEIVAAALQDHQRATVIGERTWGKASVQRVIRLEDGAVLKLTTGHYQRPSGKPLDRTGVHPGPSHRLRMEERELAEWTQQHRKKLDGDSLRRDRQLELARKAIGAALQ